MIWKSVKSVFPRDKREAFARRSCSNKELKRDDDSTQSHRALGARGRVALPERILDRRRGLPDTAHADGRAVGDEQQLVGPALGVGRRAGDARDLLGGEISGLAADAGRGLLG